MAAGATELEMIGRLALAGGLGLAMGFERELRGKAAGIRTHALVAMGSALFALVGAYGFADVGVDADPTRVAAQIASGIGFIGAGAILRHGRAIAGLTTAATVWVSAALGVGAASGLYILTSAAAAFGLFVIVVVSRTQRVVHRLGRRQLSLTYRLGYGTLGPVLMALERVGSVSEVSVVDQPDERHGTLRTLTLGIDGAGPGSLERAVEELHQRPEVVEVRWDDEAGPPEPR
jgi:putative Mg2+ transporter-C (MgtC) family protein